MPKQEEKQKKKQKKEKELILKLQPKLAYLVNKEISTNFKVYLALYAVQELASSTIPSSRVISEILGGCVKEANIRQTCYNNLQQNSLIKIPDDNKKGQNKWKNIQVLDYQNSTIQENKKKEFKQAIQELIDKYKGLEAPSTSTTEIQFFSPVIQTGNPNTVFEFGFNKYVQTLDNGVNDISKWNVISAAEITRRKEETAERSKENNGGASETPELAPIHIAKNSR